MANEAYFIVQRKYFHVLMKVLSFFIAFLPYFIPQKRSAKDCSGLQDSTAPNDGRRLAYPNGG